VKRISATELAKNLSQVLNRVCYQGESVCIERGGRPVCQISPVSHAGDFTLSNLVELLRTLGGAGSAYADAVRTGVGEQEAFQGTEWSPSSTRASSSK
jgi:antitoxin (DNA-binding transcriptional repressor) of toxin-antitoxin stability system